MIGFISPSQNQVQDNYAPSFLNSVSQLAKPRCPTLKSNTGKDLTVGRNRKQKVEVNNPPFLLTNWDSINNIIQLCENNPFFFDFWLEMVENSFQNFTSFQYPEYTLAIKIKVLPKQENILLRLVNIFTLINQHQRSEKQPNTFISEISDFKNAFQVYAWRYGQKKTENDVRVQKLLIAYISTHLNGKTFTKKILFENLSYTYITIRKTVVKLEKQGKIYVYKIGKFGRKIYKLT